MKFRKQYILERTRALESGSGGSLDTAARYYIIGKKE